MARKKISWDRQEAESEVGEIMSLKPCPFCGNSVNIIYGSTTKCFEVYHRYMKKCIVEQPLYIKATNEISTLKSAYEVWNGRTEANE